jgi:hypothetical protein
MKRGLIVVLAALCYLLLAAWGGTKWSGEPWSGAGEPPWPDSASSYIINGYLTDAGAEAMYAATELATVNPSAILVDGAIPSWAKDFDIRFVSWASGGNGILAQGDDDNSGDNVLAPWRSFDKVVTSYPNGGAIIFFDDDTASVADDFGPEGCTLNVDCHQYHELGTWTCPDPRAGCLYWIALNGDSNPATMPTIDCATNSVDIGFHPDHVGDPRATFLSVSIDYNNDDGWFEWQGVDFTGCPIDDDDSADIIAMNGGVGVISQVLLMNFSIDGLQGNLNQIGTDHNGGFDRMVAVNTECTVDEDEANPVQCFYGFYGNYYIMGRNTFESVTESPAGATIDLIKGGTGMRSVFVMGHELVCNSGAGICRPYGFASSNTALFDPSVTPIRYGAVVDVLVRDADGGAGSVGIFDQANNPGLGPLGFTSQLDIFKTTVTDNTYGIYVPNTDPLNSRHVNASCVLVNGVTGYTMEVDLYDAAGDPTYPLNDSDVVVTNSLYDDSEVVNNFLFSPSAFDGVAEVVAAAPANFPSQASFSMTDLDGTDPLDVSYLCDDASCEGACETVFTYRFPYNDYVPKDVLGQEFTGVVKNRGKNQDIGWR